MSNLENKMRWADLKRRSIRNSPTAATKGNQDNARGEPFSEAAAAESAIKKTESGNDDGQQSPAAARFL